MAKRTQAEIDKERLAATAKPKDQVISELTAAVGAVPVLIGAQDDDPAPEDPTDDVEVGRTRPEDEMVWGEVISTDGQFRQELFSVRGKIGGRRVQRAQEIATGVRTLIYKILIPQIEFPREEAIRVSMTNIETEAALAGNMEPAQRKCQQMGCQKVELRGRGLVFTREVKKYRFIPDPGIGI